MTAMMKCIDQKNMGKTFDIPEPFSIFAKDIDISTDTPCPGWLDGHTNDIVKG
jgi:hypothetical protein